MSGRVARDTRLVEPRRAGRMLVPPRLRPSAHSPGERPFTECSSSLFMVSVCRHPCATFAVSVLAFIAGNDPTSATHHVARRIHQHPFRLRHPPPTLQRRALSATREVVGAGRPYKSEYLQFHNQIYAIFAWHRPGVYGGCSYPPGVKLPRRRVFSFVFSLSTLEDTGALGWYRTLRECERAVARAPWP
jgi:hypothetical protein